MGNQTPTNSPNSSEEIDLGQLLKMMRRGLDTMFTSFLKLFLYLKKNFIILAILVITGIILVLVLNQFVPKKLKTEVIVKPNFESKNYLYDVVQEIDANIRERDTLFFKNLGIDIKDLNGFSVTIEPIEEKSDKAKLENDLKFLELLQKFQGDGLVLDVFRAEILKKSTFNHRITFFYKDANKGDIIVKKFVEYINTNNYFNDLKKVYTENAISKIKSNEALILQIDELITNYTKNLGESAGRTSEGTLVLDNEKSLDVPGLLNLKNGLIKEIERKKLELVEQQDVINIINLGKSQQVTTTFFNKRIVAIPTYLVLAFFLVSFIGYLNKKSNELAN